MILTQGDKFVNLFNLFVTNCRLAKEIDFYIQQIAGKSLQVLVNICPVLEPLF